MKTHRGYSHVKLTPHVGRVGVDVLPITPAGNTARRSGMIERNLILFSPPVDLYARLLERVVKEWVFRF